MIRRTLARWTVAGAAALALTAGAAEAQGRGRGGRGSIPPGHLPPPGECRVWYDDRPPGQQPAPTSCAAARREASRGDGRVIYGGGEGRDNRRDRDDRGRDRDDRDDRDGRDDRDRDDRDERGCEDRDRDGRCDDDVYGGDRRYPETLPETVWGVIFGRGDRLAVGGVRRWLGSGDVRPRYTDADRDGRPEEVTWYDARGAILQRWIDDTRDGRADRVALYRDGRVLRVIR